MTTISDKVGKPPRAFILASLAKLFAVMDCSRPTLMWSDNCFLVELILMVLDPLATGGEIMPCLGSCGVGMIS